MTLPKPHGPYSLVRKVDNIYYLSGQIGFKNGVLQISSLELEAKAVMDNIELILQSEGLSFQDIVKCTIYTTQLKQFDTINKVYGQYFKDCDIYPVRETVGVANLPQGANLEISAIAMKQ